MCSFTDRLGLDALLASGYVGTIRNPPSQRRAISPHTHRTRSGKDATASRSFRCITAGRVRQEQQAGDNLDPRASDENSVQFPAFMREPLANPDDPYQKSGRVSPYWIIKMSDDTFVVFEDDLERRRLLQGGLTKEQAEALQNELSGASRRPRKLQRTAALRV